MNEHVYEWTSPDGRKLIGRRETMLPEVVTPGAMHDDPAVRYNVYCPFCGSHNLRVKPVWRTFHFVSCLDCKAAGPVRKFPEEAWESWATRWNLYLKDEKVGE